MKTFLNNTSNLRQIFIANPNHVRFTWNNGKYLLPFRVINVIICYTMKMR